MDSRPVALDTRGILTVMRLLLLLLLGVTLVAGAAETSRRLAPAPVASHATASPSATRTPGAHPPLVHQETSGHSGSSGKVSGPAPVVERHVIHTTGGAFVVSGTVDEGGQTGGGAVSVTGHPKPKPPSSSP